METNSGYQGVDMAQNLRPRYLSKSRFKLGMECPSKLYYTGKPQYSDRSLDDSFLAALAEGGYQVGELAKYYYPGGHDIHSLDYNEALEQTNTLLQQENVIIYEAAVRFQNLFVRIDILVKTGNHFDLIEVKAKSYDPENIRFMAKRGGGLLKSWAPYLHDIAFQRLVLANAWATTDIDCYLMLANKAAVSTTDGLNTKFKITKMADNRKGIEVSSALSEEDLEAPILGTVCVNGEVDYINREEDFEGQSFESRIAYLSDIYEKDLRIQGAIGSACKTCQFQCASEDESESTISGFKECWKTSLAWTEEDFEDPLVIDVWNFRAANRLIAEGKVKIADLDEDDVKPKEDRNAGLSASQRQWLQVEKVQNRDAEIYLDTEGLRAKMDGWVYPLHFIDFETSATALPFTKGRRPYEGVAFQFSHHLVHADGRVEHAGEFLDTSIGHFPNFDFVRALKHELENDCGTIFKYSNHENSYLNMIFWQLKDSDLPVEEVNELCGFIKTITHSKENSTVKWKGERDMVDLLDLVKRYYYAPSTNGSNSIKYVLPAVLNSSSFVRQKYSKPLYGATDGIPSLNFKDWQWVKFDGESVIDPYKQLPKLFEDAPEDLDEVLSADQSLANGGAALTAYAKIQFTETSYYEREELRSALLKYCELDTLAMVMIFEAWKAELYQ